MINYVTRTINQEVKFLVDKKAFEDVVYLISTTIQDIKINIPKDGITINEKENNVLISIELKVKKEKSINKKINEITEEIKTHSEFLIGKKPLNIIITYVGRY